VNDPELRTYVVSGKVVVAVGAALLAIMVVAFVLVNRALDGRIERAQELESKLGRQVGPQDLTQGSSK
jgi:capsular polysaccharide biosynthesis protein